MCFRSSTGSMTSQHNLSMNACNNATAAACRPALSQCKLALREGESARTCGYLLVLLQL